MIDIQKIADTVNRMHLPKGLGDEENACSIAAINLALTGELTDKIPKCMSEVIGRWIIAIQDAMPDAMRNGAEWKALLPYAAGTGRALEKERLSLILDHMWSVTLPILQPLADAKGFGKEWKTMTTERTEAAAQEAAEAAWVAEAEAEAETAEAAARAAARAAAWAAEAEAEAAARAAAAWAAAWAAWAVARGARGARAARATWETINPCALLKALIDVKP
jgi:hypothetical protein